ncbi:hypothetical protein Tco_1200894 [Tanacetum coccineum]
MIKLPLIDKNQTQIGNSRDFHIRVITFLHSRLHPVVPANESASIAEYPRGEVGYTQRATVEPPQPDATTRWFLLQRCYVAGAESKAEKLTLGLHRLRKETPDSPPMLSARGGDLRLLPSRVDMDTRAAASALEAQLRVKVAHKPMVCACCHGTLASQRGQSESFGMLVKCALARGDREAVEELHEKSCLQIAPAGALTHGITP